MAPTHIPLRGAGVGGGGGFAGKSRLHIVCIVFVLLLLFARVAFFSSSVGLSAEERAERQQVRNAAARMGVAWSSSGDHIGGGGGALRRQPLGDAAFTADPKQQLPAWATAPLPNADTAGTPQPGVKDRPPQHTAAPDDDDARTAVLALLERVVIGSGHVTDGTEPDDWAATAVDDDEKREAEAAKSQGDGGDDHSADFATRKRFLAALLKVFDVRVEERKTADFVAQHSGAGGGASSASLAHPWCREAATPLMPECFRFHLRSDASSSGAETLQLLATSRVAAARGVYFVLKRFLNSSVMWGVGRSGIHISPAAMQHVVGSAQQQKQQRTWSSLPAVQEQIELAKNEGSAGDAGVGIAVGPPHAAQAPLRYSYNLCTHGYTMAWWHWREWEREIDWLALHGINMPLALVGQEIAWLRLWTELFPGVTQAQVLEHFTGPAFWPWHWMGNLRKWAGPVSLEYVERRQRLQQRILRRMRDELRMHVVLPAFAGHIPEAVGNVIATWYDEPLPPATGKDAEPRTFSAWIAQEQRRRLRNGGGGNAPTHVHRSALWMRFGPAYSNVLTLHPTHPLFARISARFVAILNELYGAAPFYSADQFNEMPPPSIDPAYLADAARAVVAGIQGVNAGARWVVQGWLFLHHRQIWGREQVQHYLDGAGRGNVVVLDLASDIRELIAHHNNFYGHDHIWCLLHSFGGRRGIFGDMETAVMARMLRAAAVGKETPTALVGFGLTMEATHHNPALYELATDLMFRSSDLDAITDSIFYTDADDASKKRPRPLRPAEQINANQNHNRELLQRRLGEWWLRDYIRPRYHLGEQQDAAGPPLHAAMVQLSKYGAPYGQSHDCCPSFSLIPFHPVFVAPANDYALAAMSDLDTQYIPNSIFSAAAALLSALAATAAPSGQKHTSQDTPLLYDTVDFTRQALDLVFSELHDCFQATLHWCARTASTSSSSGTPCPLLQEVEELGAAMLQLIGDLDGVTGATANFNLFDAWTGPAASWSDRRKTNKKADSGFGVDRAYFNAKNLISAWGDSFGQGYPNYAAKSWSGLYKRLYRVRWQFAVDDVTRLVRSGEFRAVAGVSSHAVRIAVARADWAFSTNHTEDRAVLAQRRALRQKDKQSGVLRDTSLFWSAVNRWLLFEASTFAELAHVQQQQQQQQQRKPLPHFAAESIAAFDREYELLTPSSQRAGAASPAVCRLNQQKLQAAALSIAAAGAPSLDMRKADLVLLRQRSGWVMHVTAIAATCSAMKRCVGFDAIGALYVSGKEQLRHFACDSEEEFAQLSEEERRRRQALNNVNPALQVFAKRRTSA